MFPDNSERTGTEPVCLCSAWECLVSLPCFPFPLWRNCFARVHVSVFPLPIFRTTCCFVCGESARQHTSKNSLCAEVLDVLDWGSDSGSFIIWGLVGWCNRKGGKPHTALCAQGLAFPLLCSQCYLWGWLVEFVCACSGGNGLREVPVLSSSTPPLHEAKYFLFFLRAEITREGKPSCVAATALHEYYLKRKSVLPNQRTSCVGCLYF